MLTQFFIYSSDPILLNSHLLANGAQQLLSIQPQLLALQQQQQQSQQQQMSPDSHPFYRKLHHGHMEPPEMNSPPLHSRKDQLFKMRNREMSKRLARMSRSNVNGHGHGDHPHPQEPLESHSPATSPLGTRVPTTNGETIHSLMKPINTEASHSSPSNPSLNPHSPKNVLEYRAMRELLSENVDKRPESQQSTTTHSNIGSQHLKINQALQEKINEKAERESPQPTDNQQTNEMMHSSPMQFSHESNDSGDEHFDELQSEL